MASRDRTIDLDDALDRRRYRCPRGHANWEPTNGSFYCESCARRGDVDPAYTRLIDHKTREEIPRSAITLVSDAGPYDDWHVYG